MTIFRALVYYESTKFNDMHVNWINCIDQGLFHYINKVTVANLIKSYVYLISIFYFPFLFSVLSTVLNFLNFWGVPFLINHPFKIFLFKFIKSTKRKITKTRIKKKNNNNKSQ